MRLKVHQDGTKQANSSKECSGLSEIEARMNLMVHLKYGYLTLTSTITAAIKNICSQLNHICVLCSTTFNYFPQSIPRDVVT